VPANIIIEIATPGSINGVTVISYDGGQGRHHRRQTGVRHRRMDIFSLLALREPKRKCRPKVSAIRKELLPSGDTPFIAGDNQNSL
jgi:hypothetical protein